MSEDLFEGEKGEDAGDPSVAYGDSTTGNTPRISSVDKLYIVLIRYTVVSLISSYCILLSQCAV
jgi:sucrose-phosphate synthase